jgi:hypothetical protein
MSDNKEKTVQIEEPAKDADKKEIVEEDKEPTDKWYGK